MLRVVSYVFHPLFMPLLLLGIYFVLDAEQIDGFSKVFIALYVLLVSVIVPLLFIWFLFFQKKVDSIMIPNIKQRKLPLVFQVFVLMFLYYTFVKYPILEGLGYVFLASAISVFGAFVLLYCRIKASLHQLGIAGLLFFVILFSVKNATNYTTLISVLIITNGLIASSRLKLKAHSCSELLIGAMLGIIAQLVLAPLWVY